MALSEIDLANALWQALGQTSPVSSIMQEYASGYIAALKAGIVTFAPGAITGTAPPSGGPLIGGAGSGGTVVLTAASMLTKTMTAIPDGPDVSVENTAIVNYTMTGLISFSTGNVTGSCTNTISNPGAFIGAGSNGTISGLSGAGMAAAAAASGAVGPYSVTFYTSLCNYVMSNAQVNISGLTGTCSAGGGPIIAAGGTGGTIS